MSTKQAKMVVRRGGAFIAGTVTLEEDGTFDFSPDPEQYPYVLEVSAMVREGLGDITLSHLEQKVAAGVLDLRGRLFCSCGEEVFGTGDVCAECAGKNREAAETLGRGL